MRRTRLGVVFWALQQGWFSPPQAWWVKTSSAESRMGINLNIWSSVWAEEISIGFSFSCTAVSMDVFGCWWLHFQLQYFVHGFYLNVLPVAVLFLIGVSLALPFSLAVALQRSRGRKKAHMLLSWTQLNGTEINLFAAQFDILTKQWQITVISFLLC